MLCIVILYCDRFKTHLLALYEYDIINLRIYRIMRTVVILILYIIVRMCLRKRYQEQYLYRQRGGRVKILF